MDEVIVCRSKLHDRDGIIDKLHTYVNITLIDMFGLVGPSLKIHILHLLNITDNLDVIPDIKFLIAESYKTIFSDPIYTHYMIKNSDNITLLAVFVITVIMGHPDYLYIHLLFTKPKVDECLRFINRYLIAKKEWGILDMVEQITGSLNGLESDVICKVVINKDSIHHPSIYNAIVDFINNPKTPAFVSVLAMRELVPLNPEFTPNEEMKHNIRFLEDPKTSRLPKRGAISLAFAFGDERHIKRVITEYPNRITLITSNLIENGMVDKIIEYCPTINIRNENVLELIQNMICNHVSDEHIEQLVTAYKDRISSFLCLILQYPTVTTYSKKLLEMADKKDKEFHGYAMKSNLRELVSCDCPFLNTIRQNNSSSLKDYKLHQYYSAQVSLIITALALPDNINTIGVVM